MMPEITCATIGEGNILLCCLRDLLQQGFHVHNVFTTTECVKTFCFEHDIPCHDRNADLLQILEQFHTDYLFSISNPRILKDDVLKIPKKLTINYHDSLLPAYAGVHATSWAIINGERCHGISWHVVESGIDTGDILQSEIVEILENDSALTLNLKCVEAAKTAFKRLIEDIASNNLIHRKQSGDRSYYGLYAIPPNVGVLNFNNSFETVYNLARGLEFGHHENALGSPKVKTPVGKYLLVTNATKPDSNEHYNSVLPGTIIEIIDDTLVVATRSDPIHVSIAKLDGSSVSHGLFKSHGLQVGNCVDCSMNIDVNELAVVRKKEGFWRKKLVMYEPTMFYRQKMNVVASIIDVSTEIQVKSVRIQLPIMKDSMCQDADKTLFLQASFVAFLARINCSPTVHVGLLHDKKDIPHGSGDLYSDITPGVFGIESNSSISSVFEKCEKEIKLHKGASTFLRDMFYRYPEMRGHQPTPQHNIVMSATKHLTDCVIQTILQNCNVLILFDGNDDSHIEVLYHKRPAQDFSHVTDVLHHFVAFLNAVNDSNESNMLNNITMVSKEEMNLFYSLPPTDSNEIIETETISTLVDKQCRLTPLSIAIKTTETMITYKKLANEIEDFHAVLKKAVPCRKVNRKQVVAIYAQNSVTYVLSVLALSKSNMAFLPLPVDLPAERIVFTVMDAHISTILMTKEMFDQCDLNGMTPFMRVTAEHTVVGEKVVVVEIDRKFSGYRKADDSDLEIADSDFLYLMYTSGSTGRPKGVKVKESGTINLSRAQITCWDIIPGDVVAQFASIGFDASISEIFTALLSGATLAVLGSKERLGNDFIAAIKKMKVTVITLPPSALNIYKPEDLPTLRKVVTAGEACTLNIAIKWTSVEDVRFFNAYGPTEATVCATVYEHLPGTIYEDVNRDLPIGKAINGVHVYLFDDYMHPIPPDVVGEVYIGGKGLAHGYIGHATHMTKEKFVQNPLTNMPSLLYKTGDHGFQDTDGNITYIGRTDDQVKIRGHRIDLSEIEQVLIQHPKIEMAVVVVHKCSSGSELALAAFVAPTFIYVSELREYLSKVLPRYMMPTYIKKVDVQELPKTINGKINRKKLEQDESIHMHNKIEGFSHLNETQLTVAKYWCTVFKLDESFIYTLHRQSSFSELGGNSLQLVLLLRLIEDDMKIKLSFTDLGTSDTIEEFAEVIRRRKDIKSKSEHNDVKTRNELRELIYQDSELDPSFFPHPDRRRSVQFTHYTTMIHKTTSKKHPKNILLSGVTGFLGAFLLSEILEQSNSHVCCMVRETSEARGIGRIIDNMRKYGLWKFEYTSRIAVVISDLSQKNLGIAPDIYKSLCNAIDVVFMNAAHMNFNTTYEDHRIANVEGTKEFIKLALTGVQKYLFTTSSLSVFLFPNEKFESGTGRRICRESEFFDDPLMIEGGYGQSKWASERLIMQALDFLPGGAIFRPARVSGRSNDGVAPKNDLFASTIYGMKKMGSYPDMDFPYDLTPVDFCAKSMIEVALKICNTESESYEKVYHLFNQSTIPFKDLFKGMGLKPLPLTEWRAALRNIDASNKDLVPLTPFFCSEFWDRAPDWPVFDTTNLENAISDQAKSLLKSTEVLLPVYKKFFGI